MRRATITPQDHRDRDRGHDRPRRQRCLRQQDRQWGFFDHMLDQPGPPRADRHFGLRCAGDLHIDDSPLGRGCGHRARPGADRGPWRQARASGATEACHLAMDEALPAAPAHRPVGAGPYLVWDVGLPHPDHRHLFRHRTGARVLSGRFRPMAASRSHVTKLAGINSHHIAEATFKSVARALREAVEPDPRRADAIPSTKGSPVTTMTTVLIDYDSGNLHSAEKAFQRMAAEGGHGPRFIVTAGPTDAVGARQPHRACPADGAFRGVAAGACKGIDGLEEGHRRRGRDPRGTVSRASASGCSLRPHGAANTRMLRGFGLGARVRWRLYPPRSGR